MTTEEQLLNAIKHDAGMDQASKEKLYKLINSNHSIIKNLLAGGAGAGLAELVGSYFKLTRTSQILLSTAGFGVGQIVLDMVNNKNKPITYAVK